MKIIDTKYHVEGDQIIKTGNGQPIPDDEPMILFRAKDRLAIPMLRAYRAICVEDGCTDYHLNGLDKLIQDFGTFKEAHPERMKQPGSTMGK